MVDRYIRDGKVAVLISRGYGAGWSTWNQLECDPVSLVFDPQIVDLVLRASDDWQQEVEALALLKYPGAYLGGINGLEVVWVPQGTQFRVTEYDGAEDIETRDTIDWIMA